MSDIEVVAIDGLDAAIIGSTVRNGREVLAYDYDKAIAIIIAQGYSEEYAEQWIADVSSKEFDGAPAFVYFDNDQEFYGSSAPPGATIH
jgi:uncharacterized protein YecE (DUF72 family)